LGRPGHNALLCPAEKASPERIAPLLARLGLDVHAHKPVNALSGGLKQRLALAIALLADPPLLLLDEPTASLDTAAQQDYLRLLANLRDEGKTILFASHRLEEVEALADRALLLEHGRLVDIFPADQLRGRIAPDLISPPMDIASASRNHRQFSIRKGFCNGTNPYLDNCSGRTARGAAQ
jgi:ABC-type multidrug transport system ATPase subunit